MKGLGGGTKTKYLRNIIGKEGAELVCIQKTKLVVMTDARCFFLWVENNIGWLHNKGAEGVGSILTMWHKEAFNYESHIKGKVFMAVFGQHIKSKANIMMANVYAPCNGGEKKILWE